MHNGQDHLKVDKEKSVQTPTSNGFYIEDIIDRYLLHNVQYQGNPVDVDISKTLRENGKYATIDQHVEGFQKEDSGFKLADATLDYAINLALYDNQNHPDSKQKALVGKVKEMRQNDLINEFVSTGTKWEYSPEGDAVVHNYRTPNEKRVEAKLVGPDGFVSRKPADYAGAIKATFGTDDVNKFVEVYSWISGKDPYVFRFNERPTEKKSRALVLGNYVFNGRFGIDADDGFYDGVARGVVVRSAQKTAENK